MKELFQIDPFAIYNTFENIIIVNIIHFQPFALF